MGRKLTASEETALLQQTVREAHEVLKDLRAVIREAYALAPGLVDDFQAVATREVQEMANFLAEESNRHAADLNADVERAREIIRKQIMSGKAVFDRHTSTVIISWGNGKFDDNVAIPYPNTPPKENTQ